MGLQGGVRLRRRCRQPLCRPSPIDRIVAGHLSCQPPRPSSAGTVRALRGVRDPARRMGQRNGRENTPSDSPNRRSSERPEPVPHALISAFSCVTSPAVAPPAAPPDPAPASLPVGPVARQAVLKRLARPRCRDPCVGARLVEAGSRSADCGRSPARLVDAGGVGSAWHVRKSRGTLALAGDASMGASFRM